MDSVSVKVLSEIGEMLKKAGISNYEREAKWLADFAETEQELLDFAKKRSTHYPLQYILGEWDFYGLTFKIGEGVLIPRPETEILVDKVIKKSKISKPKRIADLCTGCGIIAFVLEKYISNAEITAIDYSEEALKWAEINSEMLNSKVKFLRDDVLNFSENFSEKFDIITCNPPYLNKDDMLNLQEELKYEPTLALNGSEDNDDGLKYYRVISKIWRKSLAENGRIFFEIGAFQGEDVKKILADNDYKDIEIFKDYSGLDRVVTGVAAGITE